MFAKAYEFRNNESTRTRTSKKQNKDLCSTNFFLVQSYNFINHSRTPFTLKKHSEHLTHQIRLTW